MRRVRDDRERQDLGRRDTDEKRRGRKIRARKLPEARSAPVRKCKVQPRQRMQQMRRAVRRLPAVFALCFGGAWGRCCSRPAAAETIQLKKHPGGGYLISGRINDAVSVNFVLDTCASDVSIPENVARELEQSRQARSRRLSRYAHLLCSGGRLESPEPARFAARGDGRRADRVECHGQHQPIRQPAAAGAEFSVEICLLDALQRARRPRPEDQGR